MAEIPQWYESLLKIGSSLKARDGESLKSALPALQREVMVSAPILLPALAEFISALAADSPEEAKNQKLDSLYPTLLSLAQIELKTSDEERITNEEELAQELDTLNIHIKTSWRIVWNYWRGTEAGDYREWLGLHDRIKQTPLTRTGRLRLLAKHQSIGNKIHPTFAKMVVQLWPLAALWLLQKLGPVILDKAVKGAIEARQRNKKLHDMQDKILMASSKTELGKSSDFFKPKSKPKRR